MIRLMVIVELAFVRYSFWDRLREMQSHSLRTDQSLSRDNLNFNIAPLLHRDSKNATIEHPFVDVADSLSLPAVRTVATSKRTWDSVD
jgi:hypothetical protein